MTVSKILFVLGGFLFLLLGIIGIALPVLPATPFFLAASLCFLKGSARVHAWLMAKPFFSKRIARLRNGAGLTKKEKLSIYGLAFVMLLPLIILSPSPHLRIFLVVLLLVKALVFLRMKTAPASEKPLQDDTGNPVE
ncbi:MAG: YbaN family protein [Treponema sp.]|nr:YbaN family protein [Treponema sp.]